MLAGCLQVTLARRYNELQVGNLPRFARMHALPVIRYVHLIFKYLHERSDACI